MSDPGNLDDDLVAILRAGDSRQRRRPMPWAFAAIAVIIAAFGALVLTMMPTASPPPAPAPVARRTVSPAVVRPAPIEPPARIAEAPAEHSPAPPGPASAPAAARAYFAVPLPAAEPKALHAAREERSAHTVAVASRSDRPVSPAKEPANGAVTVASLSNGSAAAGAETEPSSKEDRHDFVGGERPTPVIRKVRVEALDAIRELRLR